MKIDNDCLQSHKIIIIEGLFESTNNYSIELWIFLEISFFFGRVIICNCAIQTLHASMWISRHPIDIYANDSIN